MRLAEQGIGIAKKLAQSNLLQPELDDLRREWETLEEQFRISLRGKNMRPYEEGHDAEEEIVHRWMFPFMDASGLIISGGDFQIYFDIRLDATPYLFSWREWGHYQAEWVAKHYPGTQYTYIDFYSDSETRAVIEDYEQFLQNLRSIRA